MHKRPSRNPSMGNGTSGNDSLAEPTRETDHRGRAETTAGLGSGAPRSRTSCRGCCSLEPGALGLASVSSSVPRGCFLPCVGTAGEKRLHLPSGRAFCVSVQASAGQPRWSSWDGALGVREGQQAECTPTQPPLFRCGPALIPPPPPPRFGVGVGRDAQSPGLDGFQAEL